MVLAPSSTTSILDIDAFGLLVGLFSSLPSLGDQVAESHEFKGVPQFNPILVIKKKILPESTTFSVDFIIDPLPAVIQ